jgi:anti-repressor protein
MTEYGFLENEDFTTVQKSTLVNNGAKREIEDYALTLDCAKSICMLQRNKKGEEARTYFIAMEKLAREKMFATAPVPPPPAEFTLKEALRIAYEKECENEAQRQQIAILHPKAEYADKVLNSESAMNIGTIAKDLGMSAVALNALLHQKGIQYRSSDGLWIPYAKYQDKGYTKIETVTQITSDGRTKTYHHLKWTERGKAFINWLVNPSINKKPPTIPPTGVQIRT